MQPQTLTTFALQALPAVQLGDGTFCLEVLQQPTPAARDLLDRATAQLLEGIRAPSGLFINAGTGARRRFPNFAPQVYPVLALATFGRVLDHPAARAAAVAAADALIACQRDDGGWPWIYDAAKGTVVEPYELYTVHQDDHGADGFSSSTRPLRRTASAPPPSAGCDGSPATTTCLWRCSIATMGSFTGRSGDAHPWPPGLYGATAVAAAGARVPQLRTPLEINSTDRPYHLGWILKAWAGREDDADDG